MTEFLGGIGLLLIFITLFPFILRRLSLWKPGAFFARCHHWLALTGTAVLTLHGLVAVTGGRHGRGDGHADQWGGFLRDDMLTGVISWLVLLAIVVLALRAAKKKPFPRAHCWLVGLLAVMLAFHL